MRIRISDPALLGDLQEYLRRNGCVAIQTGSDTVAVSTADDMSYVAARYAIGFRLSDWLEDHADTFGRILD
jgi:hypothetical protein